MRRVGKAVRLHTVESAEDARAFLIKTHERLSAAQQARRLRLRYSYVLKLRSALIAEGKIQPGDRKVQRPWRAGDDRKVDLLLRQGRSVVAVAEAVGRTARAVVLRLRARGTTVDEVRAGHVWSVRQVAALFGVGEGVTYTWKARGWLRSEANGSGEHLGRALPARGAPEQLVTRAALAEFLAVREAWPAYEPAQIGDAALRTIAEQERARAGGRWLSSREYAQLAGYHINHVSWLLTHGKVQGTKIEGRIYVWIEGPK